MIAAAGYLALSLVQVIALAAGGGIVAVVSKVLLMPALAVAFLMVSRSWSTRIRLAVLAPLGLSWLGDLLLLVPGDGAFLFGLSAFLLAHLAYLVLFTVVLRVGRPPLSAIIVYLPSFVLLVLLLWPHVGGLLVPVLIYGAVLHVMAAIAAAGGEVMAFGGLLFVVSDGTLALGRFLPGYGGTVNDAVVMATYCAAQGLIVLAVVLRRSDPGTARS